MSRKMEAAGRIPRAKHVERGRLALLFGAAPMFDLNALAAIGTWPTHDIACCKDAGSARFQEFVDDDAPV